jgi:hypothetical protein
VRREIAARVIGRAERERPLSAHLCRDVAGKRASRYRDNVSARSARQRDRQRAEEADTHDRDTLAGLDTTPIKDIPGAGERLPGKFKRRHPCRQRHDRVRRRDIALGVCAVGEECDTVAGAVA